MFTFGRYFASMQVESLKRENRPEASFEDIMAKNFPKLMNDINLITESSSVNPQNIKYKNK